MSTHDAAKQAAQDAKDLRDILSIVDIYRCPNCKRMGVRPGLLCAICGYDTSTNERWQEPVLK